MINFDFVYKVCFLFACKQDFNYLGKKFWNHITLLHYQKAVYVDPVLRTSYNEIMK